MPKIIIAVDDDADILKLIEDILKPEGYTVIKAQSGAYALRLLKKIKPELILLDFFMPGISGRDVCEKVRADSRLKNVKVVFLTSATFLQSGKKEIEKMDVADYIKKPFEIEDFKKRIKKIV